MKYLVFECCLCNKGDDAYLTRPILISDNEKEINSLLNKPSGRFSIWAIENQNTFIEIYNPLYYWTKEKYKKIFKERA